MMMMKSLCRSYPFQMAKPQIAGQSKQPAKQPVFSGHFQLGGYVLPEGECLHQNPPEINRENLNVDYGGRSRWFVGAIKSLAQKVKTKLPDNILVSVGVGPFGGLSAYDFATIQVLSDDKKTVLAEKRFWRANGLSVMLPLFLCDRLFTRHVMQEAEQLSQGFVKNPETTQKQFPPYPAKLDVGQENGPYSGYW
jgi:hypothetical protein